MEENILVSDQIFFRWFEKLRQHESVPDQVVEELESLRRQEGLSNVTAYEKLLNEADEVSHAED